MMLLKGRRGRERMEREIRSEGALIEAMDKSLNPVNIYEMGDKDETLAILFKECPTKGRFALQLGVKNKAICKVSKVLRLSEKEALKLLLDKICKGYILFINSERQAKYYNVEDEYKDYYPYEDGEMYILSKEKKYSRSKACWFASYKDIKPWINLSE